MITKDTFDDRAADGELGTVTRFATSRPTTGPEKVEKFYLEHHRLTLLERSESALYRQGQAHFLRTLPS